MIAVAVAATATALIALLPALSFAYHSRSAHVALEAAGAVTAMIAALIVYGRVARGGSLADMLLCVALLGLGLAGVVRTFAPSFNGHNNAVIWIPIASGLIVAVGALGASLLPPGLRVRHRNRGALYVAATLVVGCALVAAVAALSDYVPIGIEPRHPVSAANGPMVEGSTILLSMQLAAASLFLAAAAGFARRAERSRDELMGWIALACVFGAFARVNYFLFPSIYADWIFTGDIFRVLAYVLVLSGAFRELATHHRTEVRAAVLAERQRIARDLHDGLAQDLAYLSFQGGRLGQRDGVGELARTAQEALVQSRIVIANLGLSDMPLSDSVVSLAQALTARDRIRLELDVEDAVDARADERDDLLRVLSEAVANAVRHGHASTIKVSLARRPGVGLSMSIADDGRGFDPRANHGSRGATGLDGMRARIDRHMGSLRVSSEPGGGTVVEVVLDQPRRPARRG